MLKKNILNAFLMLIKTSIKKDEHGSPKLLNL